MVNLKPGDRVDCRVKANAIVGPYRDYDILKTFEIVATDQYGYYLYVPIHLTIKGSVKADQYQCKQLGIDKRFVDERIIYIQGNLVFQINHIMDGMCCARCREFYPMASANQDDGTLICFSCRSNPYR
jgi:hypothetical protein